MSFIYYLFHHPELYILIEFFSEQKFYFFSFLSLSSNILSFSAILKGQILKNQCSTIVPGTEGDILKSIYFWFIFERPSKYWFSVRHNFVFRNRPRSSSQREMFFEQSCTFNSTQIILRNIGSFFKEALSRKSQNWLSKGFKKNRTC